jgi:hypothetical protein
MAMGHQNVNIQGDWTPADDSRNRVEIAATERDNLLALRDSYDPQEVVFITKDQLLNLADAVQKGRLRNLTRTSS